MRWRLRLLVRMSVASAFAVIAPSNYSQEKIARAYGIPQVRITVARCGVGQPILGGCLPPGLEPGVRFVLFVGRIEPRKNLTLLLEAFAWLVYVVSVGALLWGPRRSRLAPGSMTSAEVARR